MKYFACALLAGLALAAPRPQDLDFDAIDALPDVVSIADDVISTVISVAPLATLTASVAAEVATNPAPEATAAATPVGEPNAPARRGLEVRAACDALATAPNYYNLDLTSNDTFTKDATAKRIASNAITPSGYMNTFKASNAATKNSLFQLGVSVLDSYDTAACAAKCTAKTGCQGFNIYFSRDPSQSAGAACPNPLPTTFIRCVIFGAKVDVDTMKNYGQYRNQFQTGYAGSNGYSVAPAWYIEGYTGPEILGDAAINAPLDCNGVDTYMGVKIYQTGVFDPTLCAAACTAQTKYNIAHPPKDGPARKCRFFNAYIISVDDEPQGQYCALYTQYWDPSYAVNKVQYRGDAKYTKTYSFTYYVNGDKGLPVCDNPRLVLSGEQRKNTEAELL